MMDDISATRPLLLLPLDRCQVRKRRRRLRSATSCGQITNSSTDINPEANDCLIDSTRRINDNQLPTAYYNNEVEEANDLINMEDRNNNNNLVISALLNSDFLTSALNKRGSKEENNMILPRKIKFKKCSNNFNSNRRTQSSSSILLISTLVLTILQLINCQRLTNSNQQQDPSTIQSQNNNNPPLPNQMLPELRGDPNSLFVNSVQPASNPAALNNLINLLYNQQSANSNPNQLNRRLPLPMNGRGIQPQQQQQQVNQGQQVSTPVNPFNQIQFPQQNNQRQQQQQRPNQQQFPQQPNNNNQLSFVSSSPATPYLTLNRINSQLAAAQNSQQQNQRPQQQFNNNNNNNNLQPLNTIPLGSINRNNNNQNNNPILMTNGMMPPPRGMQPQQQQQQPRQQFNQMPQQVSQNNNNNNQPQRIPNIPPQQANIQQPPLKPITGFAPSGPPPSLAANNGAMTVVQSPSSPNPLPSSSTTSKPQLDGNKIDSEKPTDEKMETTVISSSSTSPAPLPENTVSDQDDNMRVTSTTTTGKSSPSENTAQSGGGISSPAPIDLTDKSVDDLVSGGMKAAVEAAGNWNPVESNKSTNNQDQTQQKNRVTLAPSPDIVTVPPGYNPDNPQPPQNYDISVSAQMGGNSAQPNKPPQPSNVMVVVEDSVSTSASLSTPTSTFITRQSSSIVTEPSSSISDLYPPSLVSSTTTTPTPSIAPTAVTTIIWSPSSEATLNAPISPSTSLQRQPVVLNTRIRDVPTLMLSDEPSQTSNNDQSPGVVYGKPQTRDSKPAPPSVNQAAASNNNNAAETNSSPTAGRPFIQPVQIENQVRPFSAGAAHPSSSSSSSTNNHLLKSNHHSSQSSFQRPSRPLNGQSSSPMNVGSGFTITASGNQTMPTGDIQDYVAAQPPLLVPSSATNSAGGTHAGSSGASGSFQVGDHNEPTISAHGGQDPANFDLNAAEVKVNEQQVVPSKSNNSSSDSNNQQQVTPIPQVPRIRRPTFKPKPAVPPIRIDSCIVDDDSSCDQSHNERCVTEYGISSCHCKPGYARLSQLRGYCSPISALQLSMKIDRLSDDRRLAFNHTLDNSNSEEYQYLEFEAIQALASAFQQTSLAKQFMGARVNKFFERKGKVWVNMSVNFDLNNMTKSQDKIQQLAGQELLKVTQLASRQKPLGDSTIMLDGSKETVSKLTDINECANKELNDCSKFATCTNEFGGFQCQCLPGYEDKYQLQEDKSKHGRVCLGCSASYCSNRGECSIQDGQKQCKCRPNFVGSRCDYDTEVLAVAIGGSIIGVIILIITCWCLYIFNRRWKREQQKMDAMSATSGLTYNYVNSASTNSLMSPTRMIGGLHRSGGHQVGAMAANYGQRIVNGTRGGGGGNNGSNQHYAPDQQAIIGSTSSGSSAASQPIGGCNLPYTSGGGYQQYEDAGLLIAPASTGSSEQTSPTSNSYRGIMGANGNNTLSHQMAAGNAYTLSGHHHHHHMHHPQHQMHHMAGKPTHLSQFHPAASTDYRTLNGTMHCGPPVTSAYETRWRTLQQDHGKQSALVGYYLSPDMLVGQQQAASMQQMYASPQRELCIDTGGPSQKSRKQQGRSGSSGHTLRSRSQSQLNGNRNMMYNNNNITDYHDQ